MMSGWGRLLWVRAEISACWKVAEITPLYKKGSVLEPGNHCMLAVSGTLYRLYANVTKAFALPASMYACISTLWHLV
eukprot:1143868-Pelagomonas_calceolata.AAC.3